MMIGSNQYRFLILRNSQNWISSFIQNNNDQSYFDSCLPDIYKLWGLTDDLEQRIGAAA